MYDNVYQRNARYSSTTNTASLDSATGQNDQRCVLTDRQGGAVEHKGRDEDHDDHGQEYDRRDNADGLEHLTVMRAKEAKRGVGKDCEQRNVMSTRRLNLLVSTACGTVFICT